MFDQGLHQRLVGQGRAQVWLLLQGLLVGIQCRFQLTAPGQCVAAIVVRTSVVALGEALGGRGVLTGFIERHTLPLRVLKVPGGFGGLLLLEQVQALLVRSQPEVIEVEGVARLW
ncbi:hypothetical protein D3C80_1476470 [compost metagenome]